MFRIRSSIRCLSPASGRFFDFARAGAACPSADKDPGYKTWHGRWTRPAATRAYQSRTRPRTGGPGNMSGGKLSLLSLAPPSSLPGGIQVEEVLRPQDRREWQRRERMQMAIFRSSQPPVLVWILQQGVLGESVQSAWQRPSRQLFIKKD